MRNEMICPCLAITATFPLFFPLRPEKYNSKLVFFGYSINLKGRERKADWTS